MDYTNASNGYADKARYAGDIQNQQRHLAGQTTRAETVSDSIHTQTLQLNEALSKIEDRLSGIVERLGYGNPPQPDTSPKVQPCRPGILGRIADSLDNCGPHLQRIEGMIQTIAGQV